MFEQKLNTMKKLSLIFTVVLAVFFVNSSFGQITGSAHDFKAETWNTSGEICIVCHTPHNADATTTDAPLWNHETTATDFTGFLYSSSTLDATVGLPSGSSKLCLSCHDGTVAIDNFGGVTTGTEFINTFDRGGTRTAGYALIGTTLVDDHPISFDYDVAQGLDNELRASATETPSPAVGSIASVYLIGGQVQCGSCHDVHNSSGATSLLKVANTQSQLCLDCHVK